MMSTHSKTIKGINVVSTTMMTHGIFDNKTTITAPEWNITVGHWSLADHKFCQGVIVIAW